ncbi:MAG: hypothetical protein IPK32_19960 [Verrucomicrobiaceae bacterium]|nr:hypothetical protein [Verrucomicrobiaceae bacterium]
MNDRSNPASEKRNRPLWPLTLSVLLLILAVSFQIWQQKQLEFMIDSFPETVSQQTSVIHRALGKVIPIELPKALTASISDMEARVADQKSWPKSSGEADAMFDNLRKIMRQIPPWAEEDLLPRLNTLRWAVQSFQVLQAHSNAESEVLEAAVEDLANQVSSQPDGGSKEIAATLASRHADVVGRFAAYRRDDAIKDAKEQLFLANMTDGVAVWERLAEWSGSPTHSQQVLELRKQLRSRLLKDEVTKFAAATKANVEKLTLLTKASLRQTGYYRSLETITAQQLRLIEEVDTPEESAKVLENLSGMVEARIKAESEKQKQENDVRVRDYQKWALRKIDAFNKDFQLAQQQKEKGKLYGENIFTNYSMIRDAVVVNLLPISPGHLDLAVSKIYSQAFEEAWNKLGGKDEKQLQTEVAKQDAEIVKKTPQDYQEEKP